MAVRFHLPYAPTSKISRLVIGTALAVFFLVADLVWSPEQVRGQTAPTPGFGTTYSGTRFSAAACQVFSPLFMHKYEAAWSSTLVLANYDRFEITAEIRMAGIGGNPVINRFLDVPAQSFLTVPAAQLGLPEGFAGSISATACPNKLNALVYFDKQGSGTGMLEGVTEPSSMLFLPITNDPPAVPNRVLVYNTELAGSGSVSATVTYRVRGQEPVRETISVPRGAPMELDLSKAPKGQVGIEIQGLPNTKLVAAVYEARPDGTVGGNNAIALQEAGSVIALPLAYRRAGGDGTFSSVVRVMNVRQRPVQPRLTFYTNSNQLIIGPLTMDVVLGQGESAEFPLTAIPELADNEVYSVLVDFQAPLVLVPGSNQPVPADAAPPLVDPPTVSPRILSEDEVNANAPPLIAVAIATSQPRLIQLRYVGVANGGFASISPLIARGALGGMYSGIQIQNLSTTQRATVTVVFLNQHGRNITSWTTTVEGSGSAVVYAPEVRDLAEGYLGAAIITSTQPVASVTATLRGPARGPVTSPPAASGRE